MAGVRWLETDTLSNQNISSALAIGAYTANADRAVMVQAFVDQAVGSGDYVMYATLKIGGAGSAYVLLPKTTMTAAAGETAIAGQSGWINVRNGDVVTVYVDGLAGDTTTPDTIVRWFEDAALQPTTADRTLAVASSGECSADAVKISGDSTAADNLEAALDGTGGVTIKAGITGSLNGSVLGSVLGHVLGNIGGNVQGNLVGNVQGDVQGGVGGSIGGNVQGNLVGNVQGDIQGDLPSVILADGSIKAQTFDNDTAFPKRNDDPEPMEL